MRRGFAQQHPFLAGWLILFGLAFVVTYWYVFVIFGILTGLGWATRCWIRRVDRQHFGRLAHERELEARADYEHHLWTLGDARGFYGQFPPRMPH